MEFNEGDKVVWKPAWENQRRRVGIVDNKALEAFEGDSDEVWDRESWVPIRLVDETNKYGGYDGWPAKELVLYEPCPKCEKTLAEEGDYLCRGCRYGIDD